MTAANSLSHATRRPYWLLLVLALFLAGQVASAEHWHAVSDAVDYDCALCVLSGVNGAAIVGSAWQAPALVLAAFAPCYFFYVFHRRVIRFTDSRAPPSPLIQND